MTAANSLSHESVNLAAMTASSRGVPLEARHALCETSELPLLALKLPPPDLAIVKSFCNLLSSIFYADQKKKYYKGVKADAWLLLLLISVGLLVRCCRKIFVRLLWQQSFPESRHVSWSAS